MMAIPTRTIVGLGLCLAISTSGQSLARDLKIEAEVWPSPSGVGAPANVPEGEECLFLNAGEKGRDGKVCPKDGALAARPSFGVAFSGGGARSASATLGQLRALHELGLDQKLRYISAVSGGSWAAVPYTFLPPDIADEAFLGPYIPPEAIDEAMLRATDQSALGAAITQAHLALGFLRAAFLGGFDENYAAALQGVFLDRFGIGGGDPPRFFTLDQHSLERILVRNPELTPDDFHLVRPGRPFLIVGGAIVPRSSNDELDRYPFDMTPLYVGTPFRATVKSKLRDLPVGGGYLESFAYDSDLKERDRDGDPPFIYRAEIDDDRNRFTLSDVIATSGAAPVDRIARFGRVAAQMLGFPQYEHWVMDERRTKSRDYNHGDGGLVDNVGVMPLLARGVDNIVVFVNTRQAFQAPDANGVGHLYADVVSFFKHDNAEELDNVVFDDGADRLQELRTAFARQKEAGRPLVHCADYQVRPNPRYNVRAAYEPTICWVYLDATEAWFAALQRDDSQRLKDLAARRGRFVRLPHYETFFENLGLRALVNDMAARRLSLSAFRDRVRAFESDDFRVVRLRPEQVSALAHLAAWTVCESVDAFRTAMPGVFGADPTPSCR